MNLNKSRKVQCLRGASKPEVSKDELVKDLHRKREERVLKRRREVAAERIQSVWKGRQTRIEQSRERLKKWLVQFGTYVTDQEKRLTSQQLFDEVLPPILSSVFPPMGHVYQRMKDLADCLTAVHLGNMSAIRGALGLVLRSIPHMHLEADNGDQNPCPVADKTCRRSESQWFKLLLLSSGIVESGELSTDVLLQGAATRTIDMIVERALHQTASSVAVDASRAVRRFVAMPPLFKALNRLLTSPNADLNHTESILKAVLTIVEGVDGSREHRLQQLSCFTAVILTVPRLWAKIAATQSDSRLRDHQIRLSANIGELFDVLSANENLKPTERHAALGNLAHLASFAARESESGNSGMLGSGIELGVYLNKSIDIVRQCTTVPPPDPVLWKEEITNHLAFADPGHLVKLIQILKAHHKQGLVTLAELYLSLLHKLCPGNKECLVAYCNVIAFSDDILPLLWDWLSGSLQVPAAAPNRASAEWILPRLEIGLAALSSSQTAVLALFCQAYAHLLLVLDDDDFHSRQLPLTLDNNRAIAAMICNLAFHNCFKQEEGDLNTDASEWLDVVDQFFPLLLRRLYERDNRHSFCPPELWLAPFKTHFPRHASITTPAVLSGLLNRTNDGKDIVISSSTAHVMGLCSLLLTAPQCVPFKRRLELFRDVIKADKEKLTREGRLSERQIRTTIRRDHLLADAMEQLCRLGSRLKGPLYVMMIDPFGVEEPGIDQGGMTIELIEEVIKAGLHPDTGLFQRSEDNYLYCSRLAESHPLGASLLYFLGQMVGKALYEGLLIDVPLAPFFVLRLQGHVLIFDDLATFDADLHRNLIQVKRYQGDVSDLGLFFNVEADISGRHITDELIPGGSEIAVTDQSKLQYVHLVADWHINKRVGKSINAFAAGLSQIIPIPWLRMFNPKELNALLNGGEGLDVDLNDLRRQTIYKCGYSEYSLVVRSFWRVVASFSPAEKGLLLKFVTSCSRPPLGGFEHLQPRFTISKVDSPASMFAMFGWTDVETLPTASTCFNMLKLPNYRRATTLKKKLLQAITSNSGFGFS